MAEAIDYQDPATDGPGYQAPPMKSLQEISVSQPILICMHLVKQIQFLLS